MFYFQQGLTRIQIGRSVIKLIERSQDKTADAGKSPELGPDRGQEYGRRRFQSVCRGLIERSQDKTADVGKSPELGQIVGRSMVDEDFNQCDVVCEANRKSQCHFRSSKAQLVNNKLLSVLEFV